MKRNLIRIYQNENIWDRLHEWLQGHNHDIKNYIGILGVNEIFKNGEGLYYEVSWLDRTKNKKHKTKIWDIYYLEEWGWE